MSGCEENKNKSEKKPRVSWGRRIFKIFVFLLLLGVAALVTSPLWLGPVVRVAVNAVAPGITGTECVLGSLSVNPFTGSVRFSDFRLGNPDGYDEKNAASVGSFSIDVTLSEFFMARRLHIRDLTIVDPFGSYLDFKGTNNVAAILANVDLALGSPADEEPVEVSGTEEQNRSDAAVATEEEKEPSPGIKVVIDRLHIEGGRVRIGMLPLPLPSITLTDIGKESDGLSFAELFKEIGNRVMKAGAVGIDALGSLGRGGMEAMQNAGEAFGESTKAAAEAFGESTKAVTEALGESTQVMSDAVGEGAKAVGEGAKNLVKGIGGLFGGGKK